MEKGEMTDSREYFGILSTIRFCFVVLFEVVFVDTQRLLCWKESLIMIHHTVCS